MLLTTVSHSAAVCVLCAGSVSVCVRALREVGEGSLCNLKGKYKAHKAGSASRQQERQGKGKVVGIC